MVGRQPEPEATIAGLGYDVIPGIERIDALRGGRIRLRIAYRDKGAFNARPASFDGTELAAMRTADVLERILESRSRRRRGTSALDVIAAAENEPEALREAFGVIPIAAFRNLETDWAVSASRMEDEAARAPAFDPRWPKPDPHDLPERLVAAINKCEP